MLPTAVFHITGGANLLIIGLVLLPLFLLWPIIYVVLRVYYHDEITEQKRKIAERASEKAEEEQYVEVSARLVIGDIEDGENGGERGPKPCPGPRKPAVF